MLFTPKNEKDLDVSRRMRAALGIYFHYKYLADLDLTGRTSFPWFILHPGGLTEEKATGKAGIGRTHLYPPISVRIGSFKVRLS